MDKEELESNPGRRPVDTEQFSNRKLIRPTLSRPDLLRDQRPPGRRERAPHPERPQGPGGKPAPAEQTHAENFYYQKQMQSRTPLVVVLKDGEQLEGFLEWYDKRCIKLNRADGQPSLLIYKPGIKYIFKKSEESAG
ncbi:MAG: Hfq-like protein [Terriglobales bacterium]